METRKDIAQQFKKELHSFINDILVAQPDNQALVYVQIYLQVKCEAKHIITQFCKQILPLEKKIESRNESFFMDEWSFFDNADETVSTKVSQFKEMINKFDKKNKDHVWEWFNYFVRMGKKYDTLKD